jgi:hypothetical protein
MLGKPAKFRKSRTVKSWHFTCRSVGQAAGQIPRNNSFITRIFASGLRFRRVACKTKSRDCGSACPSFGLLR